MQSGALPNKCVNKGVAGSCLYDAITKPMWREYLACLQKYKQHTEVFFFEKKRYQIFEISRLNVFMYVSMHVCMHVCMCEYV